MNIRGHRVIMDIPETASVDLELVLFAVLLDARKRRACGFLVVCFLFAAGACVSGFAPERVQLRYVTGDEHVGQRRNRRCWETGRTDWGKDSNTTRPQNKSVNASLQYIHWVLSCAIKTALRGGAAMT